MIEIFRTDYTKEQLLLMCRAKPEDDLETIVKGIERFLEVNHDLIQVFDGDTYERLL